MYGSQPNLANNAHDNSPSSTLSASTNTKAARRVAKAQSFKHQKSDGVSTPKFFRKLLSKYRESPSKKRDRIPENEARNDYNRNRCEPPPPPAPETLTAGVDYVRANQRDVTSAVVDARGATLVNNYWGVSLEIPPDAIPEGVQQEIYFVISDPRLCENSPPLDLENGINLLSFFIPNFLLLYHSFTIYLVEGANGQCT